MSDDAQGSVRHNIYLADSVWQALRQRAILERSSANRIIAYLLGIFLRDPVKIPAGRYKDRLPDESLDSSKGRTVRIPAGLSAQVMQVVVDKTSLASLIDTLLRQYLVNELSEEKQISYSQSSSPPAHMIRVGKTEYDLGERPFTLDVNSGKVKDAP